ncbi:MAG: hypothetical protein WBQ05_09970 [Candidatus Competibacter denitrificans]
MNPLRLGRWMVLIGAILTAVGLITGFAALTIGDRGLILNLLGLTPVGVLLAFSGTVLVVLTEPRGNTPPTEPESPTHPYSESTKLK